MHHVPAQSTFPARSSLSRRRAGGARRGLRRADLTGCPWHDVKAMLRDVGLRPTRQRMALGWILFAKGDRHLTAEMLYEEATTRQGAGVARHRLQHACISSPKSGLLRQVAVDGSKTYFDTNASEHHHFFVEGENDLVDIPDADVIVGKTPMPPEGLRDRPASTSWSGSSARIEAGLTRGAVRAKAGRPDIRSMQTLR